MHCRTAIFLAALTLSVACGDVDWNNREPGDFEGRVFLMWAGPGAGDAGDGNFVFIPDPDNALTFTRDARYDRFQTVTPGVMYTDGGSVPRVAQAFRGLQPWGYGPAYMVHDWLFVAHHCNREGKADANEASMAGMSFEESAHLIAEALKTLVAEGKIAEGDLKAPGIIAGAVAGPVSAAIWEAGTCPHPRISDKDQRAVDDFLSRRRFRTMAVGEATPGPAPLRLVGIIEF